MEQTLLLRHRADCNQGDIIILLRAILVIESMFVLYAGLSGPKLISPVEQDDPKQKHQDDRSGR
jgi:hypothetical protein